MGLRVAVALALVLVPAASARPAQHVEPGLSLSLAGVQTVPGGVHLSPVRDPFEGAWRGAVTWRVDCPGATRWGWKLFFSDVSGGARGLPPEVERRKSGHVHFLANASSYTSQGGTEQVTVPAGSIVYPYLEGSCYVDGHDFRHTASTEGEVLAVPPYVWYPVFSVGGRTLQAAGAGAVVLPRGRTVTAKLRVREHATGGETVTIRFAGAGVNVRKTYGPGVLRLSRTVRFTPRARGTIRYWAELEGRRSLVYGIRVR